MTLEKLLESRGISNGLVLVSNNKKDTISKVWSYAEQSESYLVISLDNSVDRVKECMRHDPDILYLRETLNSEEDVKMALRAANCGHLVIAKIQDSYEEFKERTKKWAYDKFLFDEMLLGTV